MVGMSLTYWPSPPSLRQAISTFAGLFLGRHFPPRLALFVCVFKLDPLTFSVWLVLQEFISKVELDNQKNTSTHLAYRMRGRTTVDHLGEFARG